MKHTIAIIVSALLSASVEAQTNSPLYGLYLSELERRATQTPAELTVEFLNCTQYESRSMFGLAVWRERGAPFVNQFSFTNSVDIPNSLAKARDGVFADLVYVDSVTVTTNTTQHSNAVGCPMHGRMAFGGMILTSNPPQWMGDYGHNHKTGERCYPHVPATERWTVTEVVKAGIVLVLGESFPFRVVVSRTTNSHEVLRQEWRAK